MGPRFHLSGESSSPENSPAGAVVEAAYPASQMTANESSVNRRYTATAIPVTTHVGWGRDSARAVARPRTRHPGAHRPESATRERPPVITNTKVVLVTPSWLTAVYFGVPLAPFLGGLAAWRLFQRVKAVHCPDPRDPCHRA